LIVLFDFPLYLLVLYSTIKTVYDVMLALEHSYPSKCRFSDFLYVRFTFLYAEFIEATHSLATTAALKGDPREAGQCADTYDADSNENKPQEFAVWLHHLCRTSLFC